MKALIAARGEIFPYIHDLSQLSATLAQLGEQMPIPQFNYEELTKYAVVIRYDEEAPPLTEAQRTALQEDVADLLAFAQKRVAALRAAQAADHP